MLLETVVMHALIVFHLPKRLEIILIVVLIKYAHIEQISV